MRSGFGELITEVSEVDQQESVPLGTAQLMGMREATQKLGMSPDNLSDRLWIGEAFNNEATALGYTDDRHVTLVSGTRGGKGAGVIVPNLCNWRGSCIVIDPKGENATVTARRRGDGSDYTHGLGQEVRILDPFDEVPLPSDLKACFNPLDVIDPESDLAVDDAGRIAAAIIVKESKNDPYWEDAARGLVKGLILHVLTHHSFENIRNLITVRRLLMEGDWLGIEAGIAQGIKKEDLPTPHAFLWERMMRNKAFDGVVSGFGEQMFSMATNKAEKTLSGILEQARTNTAFLDGAPMRRLLEKSDFDLADIKTSARGLTIYLTLPQRFMDTHFRWLRLMVTLTLGEMERIKGRPKTGHPTLFLLDEFPGLKRMEVIENAVAQAAGFGVKFFFVTQNLPQLKREYEDNWETFISNSGLKIFFQVDDHFSRNYLSNLLGEREVRRQSRSGSDSRSTSTTEGTSSTATTGRSNTTTFSGLHFFDWFADSKSISPGWSSSDSSGTSSSTSQSNSRTDGWSEGVHKRPLLSPDEIGRFLSRIDDKGNPAYPGLVLALTPGQHPLAARRINYFESPKFEGCFDPHPDHPPPLTLAQLADRNAQRATQRIETRKPEPKPKGSFKSFWRFATQEHSEVGYFIIMGVIALIVLTAMTLSSSSPPITSGTAVVDHQAQVNLRSCPAANCRPITTLNKGDPVTVIQSFDNGWKGVTVRYDDGKVIKGFVNGDFLSRP